MSPDSRALSKLEAWGLLAAIALFMAWYAYPQLLFSLYPLYELGRLLFPGLLPLVAPAANWISTPPGPPG